MVDLFLYFYLYIYEKQKYLLIEEAFNLSGTGPLQLRQNYGRWQNQPPRPQPAFALLGYHCVAATPPSKGGEIIMKELNFDTSIRLSILILLAKSISDPLG